jgi:hypothetical protein
MGEPKKRIAVFVAMGLFIVLCGHSLHNTIHRFDGIVGMTRKNGVGCKCHNLDPTPSVNVWIEGPDTLEPGGLGVYKLSIVGDSTRTAGFNIATAIGLLQVIDSTGTYWYEDEMTHAMPKPSGGSDTVSWQFAYVAPGSDGSLVDTLYSVANSTNQDTMATDADHWNFGENFLVTVATLTGVESDEGNVVREFALYQNYPNPFNPSTTIGFALRSEASVRFSFFDVSGRLVGQSASRDYSQGIHHFNVDASTYSLSSGVYFYRLEARYNQGEALMVTRKMTVLR